VINELQTRSQQMKIFSVATNKF